MKDISAVGGIKDANYYDKNGKIKKFWNILESKYENILMMLKYCWNIKIEVDFKHWID